MDKTEKFAIGIVIILWSILIFSWGGMAGSITAHRDAITSYYAHVDRGMENNRLLIVVEGKYLIKDCARYTFKNVVCGQTYKFCEINGTLYFEDIVEAYKD